MGPSRPRTRLVVTDATVLIYRIHVDRLALLGSLGGSEFVVHPEVEDEVRIPDQAAALARVFDVAPDERRRFLRLAGERPGPSRIVNPAGIFVLAVRAGLLSLRRRTEQPPSAPVEEQRLQERR